MKSNAIFRFRDVNGDTVLHGKAVSSSMENAIVRMTKAAGIYKATCVHLEDMTANLPEVTTAEALREHWKAGEQIFANPEALLEANGIVIIGITGETRSVSATIDGVPVIAINTDARLAATPSIQRFEMAYQLGHLVLHRDHPKPRMTKAMARDAEQFARAFLMPEGPIRAYLPESFSVTSVVKLKETWGFPIRAILNRYVELGLISIERREMLAIQLSSRGWQFKEPHEELRLPFQPSILANMIKVVVDNGFAPTEFDFDLADIESVCGLEASYLTPPPDNVIQFKFPARCSSIQKSFPTKI